MAAFPKVNLPNSPSLPRPNDKSPGRRALPEGACNYRDLNAGLKPPGCGCRRFWWTGAVYTGQERDDGQQVNPWCICGHHACFHDLAEKFGRVAIISQESSSPSMAPPRCLPANTRPIERQQEHNGRSNLPASISSSLRREMRALDDIQPDSRLSTPGRLSARHMQGLGLDLAEPPNCNDRGQELGKQAQEPPHPFSLGAGITTSDGSAACLLATSKLGPWSGCRSHRPEQRPLHCPEYQQAAETRNGRYEGLGVVINDANQQDEGRHASPSPTVPDTASITADQLQYESQLCLPSTRDASEIEFMRNLSPDTGFMQRVLATQRLAPPLDISSTVRAAEGFEDFIQSATEVATPSVSNTPDFHGLTHLVQETRDLVDAITGGDLTPLLGDARLCNIPSTTSNSAVVQDTRTSPGASSESIQAALKKIPLTLQQLTPLLTSLHGYLSRNPDISIHESLHSLCRRMDSLENSSFNHIPPEHLHEQFETIDGRLIDLENRADEHGRLIAAFDPDASTHSGEVRRLHHPNEHASFESNQSLASATSSALISAAIDRVEAGRRLKDVEARLDDLEKMQLPSLVHPWEVEVVLLPWGRELKGIWHPPSELLKPGMSQDSEPWTQARSMRSMSRASLSLGVTTDESGWSDQAIHQWADNAEDWLSPKACGSNGIVYHRMRSRGLVRHVVLTSPGARDIRNAICRSFGSLLGTISGKGGVEHADSSIDDDDEHESYLGLDAPFIPLRKVHKSSRLRFLTPSELVTPDLWTAEFLISGVIMRAPGHQKRLFISTRNSYLQPSGASWTWRTLRELPRAQPKESEGQPVESAGQVPEADALEPCWTHHPALDLTFSIQSSFASHIGAISSHEEPPVAAKAISNEDCSHHEDSEDELSKAPVHPITPTSDFPTQRPLHRRTRTVSIPLTETSSAPPNPEKSQIFRDQRNFQPQMSKRRVQSFSHSSNPLIATLPTFIPSPAKSRSRLTKRRRLTRSRSGSASAEEFVEGSQRSVTSLDPDIDPSVVLSHLRERVPSGESIMPIWAFTPQRSKEPHSPFFVDGSDTGAGASQSTTSHAIVNGRSVKRGITPSAYATPFSGTVLPPGGRNSDGGAGSFHESGEDDAPWEGVEEGIKSIESVGKDESMNEGYDDGGDDEDSGLSERDVEQGEEEEEGDNNDDDDDEMSSIDELHWEVE